MGDIKTRFSLEGEQQYRSAMTSAANAIRLLNAEQKLAASQFKNTGDAEKYAADKAQILQQKIAQQKTAVEAAEKALKNLAENGVNENSKQFQQWQMKLLNAQTALNNMEAELGSLDSAMSTTAAGADKLTNSLNGISKKISLEQVTSAIGSITGGLEKAGKKAVELGQELWSSIMDAAARADDTATMAQMYGIDLDTFKRMQALVTNGMDTSVEAVLTAQQKLNKGIGSGATATMDALRDLGLLFQTGKGVDTLITNDTVEMFWKAGQALMAMGEGFDKESTAQALFGRSWKELVPLFDVENGGFASLEDYQAALDDVTVSSDESTRNLAELNDAVSALEGSWTQLKDELIGAIAPALTGAADAVSGLLNSVTEFLQTPEGKQALDDMGKAVEGLFKDITEIDPDKVMESFQGVFGSIVGGLQWLKDNSGDVVDALKAVVEGWAVLKLAGGALEVYKLIQGVLGLTEGAAATAAAAGSAAGASWGAAFASAVTAAAPWLIGLYTLLNPSGTGNNDLADANGNMTAEGWQDFLTQRERASNGYTQDNVWYDLIMQAGEIVEAAANLWDDPAGIQALAQYAIDNDKEKLAASLQALGYVLRVANEEVLPELEGTEYTGGREGVYRKNKAGELILPIDPATPFFTTEDIEVPTELVTPADEDEKIAEQVGTVTIPTLLKFRGWTPDGVPDIPYFNGSAGGTGFGYEDGGSSGGHGFANGIWSIPFDGYRAVLHKGERVVPAREVSGSRNFSSNLYVENMNMSGGMDADALAARISAANRRTMAGWG